MIKATILAVDDEPDILVALEDLFEDEYEIRTTTSPAQALAILEGDSEIAVIVSDQRMPGMTGDQFLAEARRIHDAQAILLTGYADLSAVVAALNGGGITGYVTKPWDPVLLRSTVRNAVERHRLARDLATERALLLGLLDHTDDAIAFKDPQGRFVRLNARKAARLGREVGACLGRTEAEIGTGDALTSQEADLAAIAAGSPSEGLTTEGAAGAERWSHVVRVPIRDAAGHIAHLAVIERDVTEQRMLEARLRQSDKMQALGTLAGGIAHDFNNLLTAILGSLELVAPKVADQPRVQRLVSNATQAAQRGATLTKRLLGFSRSRELRFRAVDLNELIDGMGELIGGSLGGLVTVARELDQTQPHALVDPDQLELAILNLCINARDAMPEGGRIVIGTQGRAVIDDPDLSPGNYVSVTVRDSGTGIAPEILERVCEPFFTTKSLGQGTGLGLAMVFGLAQQSSGRLRITSTLGEGTCVELILPKAEEAQDESASPAAATAVALRSGRVLVVDDDEEVRHVTASFLAGFGYRETEAADATEALALLDAESFDLVVADLAMPGMTGIDLVDAIRRRGLSVPVLILTGHAEAVEIPDEIPVLTKPFDSADLDRVAAALIKVTPGTSPG